MKDNRDIAYALTFLVFGVWSFFKGFKTLRRKRLIENIPTSTVRGVAMGLAEIVGKAEAAAEFRSPFTNIKCVLFQYTIEEYRQSGKSGSWVKIASGDSFYSPFWLNDGTGKVLVYPHGAELILPVDYEFTTSFAVKIPDIIAAFMDKNGISHKAWIGTRSLRFKEWFIHPGEEVYVLGSAKPAPEEARAHGSPENPVDVVIGRGDTERIFMISDCSEKELLRKLSKKCLWGIYGGAALSLALLWYLLVRFRSLF